MTDFGLAAAVAADIVPVVETDSLLFGYNWMAPSLDPVLADPYTSALATAEVQLVVHFPEISSPHYPSPFDTIFSP